MSEYELHERVGEGGMGVVFRATRGEATVALKVLKPQLIGDPSSAARFTREVAAVRGLAHPGIVAALDAGSLPNGQPFIAYEWLEGPTLADRGPTSTRQAVPLVASVLDALAYAHDAGFVHRDITPRNLMVLPEGPKLIDFGLVASLARSVDAEQWTRLTRTGFVVGTPPYMAPEQIEGEPVSPQTDLWAVGIVLYWLVSGREPFVARTPTLGMLKVVSEPLESLASHAPHVDRSLVEVVERALTKNPTERFGSAIEMAEALRAAEVSDDLPEDAHRPLELTRTR